MEGFGIYNEILKIANKFAKEYSKNKHKNYNEYATSVVDGNKNVHKDSTNIYHQFLLKEYKNTIKNRIVSRLEDNACKK